MPGGRPAARYEAGRVDGALVLMVCGLPGAGKSTWARALASAVRDGKSEIPSRIGAAPSVELISFDDIERDIAESLSSQPPPDAPASVDDNFYYRSMRFSYCQLCRRHRASLLTVFVAVPPELAAQRNALRDERDRVPYTVIERMAELLEPPDSSKCQWEQRYVTISGEDAARAAGTDVFPWEEMVQAWMNPRIEGLEAAERQDAAERDRQETLKNAQHRFDLELRAAVSQEVAQAGKDGMEREKLKEHVAAINGIRREMLKQGLTIQGGEVSRLEQLLQNLGIGGLEGEGEDGRGGADAIGARMEEFRMRCRKHREMYT